MRGRGPCPTCTAARDRRRRESRVFDYSPRWWRSFRVYWFGELTAVFGLPPICGARWPDGHAVIVTRCQAAGVSTFHGLELHHWPPLGDHELTDRAAICDGRRLVAACKPCHSAMTAGGAHR